MCGEQDMRKMGGLAKKIPITYWTMLIATLAIAGIFPFAGFLSKDLILGKAYETGCAVDGGIFHGGHDRVLHVPVDFPHVSRRVSRAPTTSSITSTNRRSR